MRYLWVQLDQNVRANDSNTPLVSPSKMSNSFSGKSLQRLTNEFTNIKGEKYNGGYKIAHVKDSQGKDLKNLWMEAPGTSKGSWFKENKFNQKKLNESFSKQYCAISILFGIHTF